MKKTLNAALALILGMTMANMASAQTGGQDQQGPPPQRGEGRGPGGPEGHRGMPSPEQQLRRLSETLNLSADQQTQIKGLMESEKSQMDKLRDDTSLTRDARRASAMNVRKDTQAAIRATLTADQQAKFDKMLAEMRQHGGPRGPRPEGQNGDGPHDDPTPPPPPPPAS